MPAAYPPNPKLRAARLQRNWTYADVARELRTLMLSRGETQVGVAFQHVYRWEVGGRRPGMRHRRYLCMLYDLSPEELGFLPSRYVVPDLVIRTGQGAPSERPICRGDELEALNLTRRKLLAASGLLSASFGVETATEAAVRLAEPLDRAARVASGRAAADDAMVADLASITAGFERAYRSMTGVLLAEPLRAHINTLKTVLKQSLLPEQRQALLRTASHATALMACRQFADHGDREAARRWLAESIEFGELTDDADLHALGVVRAAEQCLYTGQPGRSVQLLAHLSDFAARRCSPSTRAWILVSQAEAYAALGRTQECHRPLGLAAEAQQRSRPEDEPVWMEGWRPSWVSSYVGAVHLRLGQPGKARAGLREALADAKPAEAKSRSIYMADLAMTYALEADLEPACMLAGKALEIAGPMNYGLTLGRVASVRRCLARWPKVRAVKDLDERLRSVAAAETRYLGLASSPA